MVYHSGSKKAASAASIANRTNVYGIIGGTVSAVNRPRAAQIAFRTRGAPLNNNIPLSPVAGLNYMRTNNLLSVNPQTSGGVGRKVLFFSY